MINICGSVCIPGAKHGMLELIPQTAETGVALEIEEELDMDNKLGPVLEQGAEEMLELIVVVCCLDYIFHGLHNCYHHYSVLTIISFIIVSFKIISII